MSGNWRRVASIRVLAGEDTVVLMPPSARVFCTSHASRSATEKLTMPHFVFYALYKEERMIEACVSWEDGLPQEE